MRVTGPLLKVLRAFLDDPAGELYGLEVLRVAGLKSGTLYPLLARLEAEGLVTSRWEETAPVDLGRPRRRLYQLTGYGAHEARQVLIVYAAGDIRWA